MNYDLIYEAIVGSQSYSTNIETSDIDKKAIYIQPLEDILKFSKYREFIEVSKDHSMFEVRRFLELLKTANPTMLELLFSPEDCIVTKKPIFDIILKHKHKFLTKKCRDSFGGYAVQQIKKASGLNKKVNWEADKITRKTPLDFCTLQNGLSSGKLSEVFSLDNSLLIKSDIPNCFHLYMFNNILIDLFKEKGFKIFGILGEDSTEVRFKSKEILYELKNILAEYTCEGLDEAHCGLVHYNKDAYTKHCKDYLAYQTWLKERSEERYNTNKAHGQNYDGKNIMHLRRLLDTALEIALEGTLNVRRPNREELLKIRRGEVDLKSVIDKAEEDILKLDEIYDKCSLPEEVSIDLLDDLLLELRMFK